MSVFSQKPQEERLFENEHYYILEDAFPVSPGHLLIVSKREATDYFDLNEAEQAMLPDMICEAKKLIENRALNFTLSLPDGYNIGMNCGTSAGQTVMHFHCHVIPRYTGDTLNPRGGIRNCIPGKGDY